jgi:hypothetical protein
LLHKASKDLSFHGAQGGVFTPFNRQTDEPFPKPAASFRIITFPFESLQILYVGQTSNGVQSLVSQLTVLENPPPNHGLSETPDKTYRKLYLG